MDVLLLIPPVMSNSLLDIKWEDHFEFLGVGYILSYLRKNGISADIVDGENLSLNTEHLKKIIVDISPKILGISVSKSQFAETKKIVSELRNMGYANTIIMGGYYPTLSTEKLLKDLEGDNIAVIGEGERTFTNLVKCILDNEDYSDIKGIAYIDKNDNVVINSMSELCEDLDSLPFPARNTLSLVQSIGGDPYLISGRGCYGNCSFCSIKAFYNKSEGKKYRVRSAKNVVDEIEYLVSKYNIKRCRIFDDNLFTGNENGKYRVREIAAEIIERHLNIEFEIVCRANDVEYELFEYLRKAGLRRVVIGLESFNDNVLRYYGKNIKASENYNAVYILDRLGIECVGSYIMFNPNSTFEEIKVDYDYYYSRLKIDKGVNLINSILSTSTILSIDEGTNLYRYNQKKKSEYLRDDYQIKDIRVDKLKKIAIYITLMIKNNIIKLVKLDKYLRKFVHRGGNYEEMNNELNKIWKELAYINLDTFGYYYELFRGYQKFEDINESLIYSKVEDLVDDINNNINHMESFEQKYEVSNQLLPRIWFYFYEGDNNVYHVFDPVSFAWSIADEQRIRIMNMFNQVQSVNEVREIVNLSSKIEEQEKDIEWILSELEKGNYRIKIIGIHKANQRSAKRLLRYILN